MTSLVEWFTATLADYISREMVIFLISMMPLLEVRGGLLAASLLDVSILTAIPICVIGNIIPIPFILLFIRAILDWMKKVPKLSKIALWLEKRAAKNSDKVSKYAAWGLFLFVAVPLPGTGAWTGALVAAVLKMRLKHSLISVIGGVLAAGLIVTGISYGVLGFLDFML